MSEKAVSLCDLAGQVAVVTGGSRGIGRALAEALAAAGATVAVAARSIDAIDATVRAISNAGGRAIGIVVDVTDRSGVARMVADVQTGLGPIDLLINNAASIATLGPVGEIDPKAWWRCQEVNIRGPMLCASAVLPAMQERCHGRQEFEVEVQP